MRYTALVALAIVAGGAAIQPARADMAPLNCDALNKSTLICVRNNTPHTITKITCTGTWGTDPLSIPQGIIKAGSTTIVDFTAGKCSKHITVFTKEGKQISFDGFDTTSNTTLLVDAD